MKLKLVATLLIAMIIDTLPAIGMPVGNISDPFVLGKGLFKTQTDFGFFVAAEHINSKKNYYSRTDQTIRLHRQNFSDITLKQTKPDKTSSAVPIVINGDDIVVSTISGDVSKDTFTLFLRNGEIVQLDPNIDDSGTLNSKKATLKYTGAKIGISYKEICFLYGMIGKGTLSKHVRFTYHIEETQGTKVRAENPNDSTTSDVIDKMTYSWDKRDEDDKDIDAINRKFETDEDIIWGLGLSVIMYERMLNKENIFRAGMDYKYRKIKLESDSFSFDETSYKWNLDEWQMAFALSLQMNRLPLFNQFIPYTGITYSYISGNEVVTMINDNAEEKEFIPLFNSNSDIEIKKNFGYFAGASLNIFNNTQINFEKKFNDEDAFEVSVLIKF